MDADPDDLGRLRVAATGSKLDGGGGSGDEGAVVAMARPPAEPGRDFELVAAILALPVLVLMASPFPCVCCCSCCWSDKVAMDLGVKGPEPGSGGDDVETSCDCDGKETSVLVLVRSLVVAALAPPVLGAAREGKDGTWVAVVLGVVVVVIVVAVVGVGQCLGGDTSLTEPSVVICVRARFTVFDGDQYIVIVIAAQNHGTVSQVLPLRKPGARFRRRPQFGTTAVPRPGARTMSQKVYLCGANTTSRVNPSRSAQTGRSN